MKLFLPSILILLTLTIATAEQYGISKEQKDKAEFVAQCKKGFIPSCLVSMGYTCTGKISPDQQEMVCTPPDNEGQSFTVLRTSGKAEWLVTQLTEGEFVPQAIKEENQ